MAAKTIFDTGVTSKLWLDRRQFYPEPQKVAEMWTDMNPFKTVLMKLGTKKVDDPVYKLFEHESNFVKREFTTSTALTIAANGTESAALTISGIVGLSSTVSTAWNGLEFEIWDSTKLTKRGNVFISSYDTTATVKVKVLKAAAITTVSGDYFIATGNRVRGEGSVALEAENDEIKTVWNSVAYLSDSCEVTGALYKADKLRGYSNEFARLREEMFKRYSSGLEGALLKQQSTVGTNFNSSDTFSEASLRTVTDAASVSGSVRTTYGYIPILEDYGTTFNGTGALNDDTNTFSVASADFGYSDLIKYAEIIFDKREKDQAFAFSGRTAITKIAQKVTDQKDKFNWVGKVQLGDTKVNKLGFNMTEFETPHGILYIVPTRSLRNQYASHMAIPDLDNIGIAEFSPDEYKNNIKTDNGYDGVKDSIESMKGLWMTLLKRHHMMIMK